MCCGSMALTIRLCTVVSIACLYVGTLKLLVCLELMECDWYVLMKSVAVGYFGAVCELDNDRFSWFLLVVA